MKGRYFKIDDLMTLSAAKLQENTPLLDISLSTISSVLGSYKSKYSKKKSKPAPLPKRAPSSPAPNKPDPLIPAEVTKIREIIDWFESQREAELLDFNDLKSALAEIGLDYRKLLDQYRRR